MVTLPIPGDTPACKSGIYEIRHLASGCVYVGSSQDITKRWYSHRHCLRKGRHPNRKLQSYWSKYGEEAFSFTVLEHVPDADTLLALEDDWIYVMESTSRNGFNHRPVAANNRGLKMSDEAKANMRAAQLGRTHSEETKAKQSAVHKGVPKSAEARAAMSVSAKVRKSTDVTKEKIRAAMMGRVVSEETRAKFSASRKGLPGQPRSVESRAKQSAATKGRTKSPETRAKMAAAWALRRAQPGFHDMWSEAQKNRKPLTEEARANMSAAQAVRGARERAERAALANTDVKLSDAAD